MARDYAETVKRMVKEYEGVNREVAADFLNGFKSGDTVFFVASVRDGQDLMQYCEDNGLEWSYFKATSEGALWLREMSAAFENDDDYDRDRVLCFSFNKRTNALEYSDLEFYLSEYPHALFLKWGDDKLIQTQNEVEIYTYNHIIGEYYHVEYIDKNENVRTFQGFLENFSTSRTVTINGKNGLFIVRTNNIQLLRPMTEQEIERYHQN